MEEEAAKHEIPFISFETVAGKNVEKNKLKKKIAKSNHGVITLTNFNRFFEISFFNRKRTPLYFYKPGTDLKTCYEEISRTCKFKLRNNTVLSFAAGYVELGEEKILQNVQAGLDFFVTLLKKGVSNIASVNIKSNQSKAIKLY
ncbi:hypothetical protein H311_02428 [Anncaliia algerae PRA109]|nr:hypothetical protein H311_02428 [Anncaliia algerae PRA109]